MEKRALYGSRFMTRQWWRMMVRGDAVEENTRRELLQKPSWLFPTAADRIFKCGNCDKANIH